MERKSPYLNLKGDSIMQYWIFKCNQDRYDLEARLQDPNPTITWNVTRYQKKIKKGDIVMLWVSGKNPGIKATFKIDTLPIEMAEIESEKSYWKEEDEPIRDRVIGTLRKKRGFVPISDIKLIALLRKMSIFGYSGATNYLITEDQGKVLLKMFDSSKVLVNA